MRSDYVPYKSTIKIRVTEVKPNISFNFFPSLQLEEKEEEEVEKVVQKVSSRQQSHSTYPAHLLSVLLEREAIPHSQSV